MSKRVSQLTELTSGAEDDYLPIVDTSSGTLKKISVKNLTGLPDVGWVSTGESWSYSAWSSALKRGTITVPTDATTKYTEGMFVRFSQSTGGTKWGQIVTVTATTLVVYMGSSTLNNEAISSPVYSSEATPVGLPMNIKKYLRYAFRARRTTAQNTGAGAEAIINFNTEDFDYNSNFDVATNIGRYTAPVAGLYHFSGYFNSAAASNYITLYKNGVAHQRGTQAGVGGVVGEFTVESAAGDYWEIYSYANVATAMNVAVPVQPYFSGYLISGN